MEYVYSTYIRHNIQYHSIGKWYWYSYSSPALLYLSTPLPLTKLHLSIITQHTQCDCDQYSLENGHHNQKPKTENKRICYSYYDDQNNPAEANVEQSLFLISPAMDTVLYCTVCYCGFRITMTAGAYALTTAAKSANADAGLKSDH